MAPEKAPAFQFYPKDLLSDINFKAMSLAERGAYFTLLAICWVEQSLPTDADTLARVLGVPKSQFVKLWPHVAVCFREIDGRLRHPRLDEEREKQEMNRRRASDKAAKGAEARWAKHAPSMPQASPSMPQAMPNDGSSSSTATAVVPPTPTGAVVAVAEAEVRRGSADLLAADDITQKAVAFMEIYPALYAKCRAGAAYRVREARDFPAFCELVTQWPDLNHLSDMLRLFLLRKEFAPKNEPGSPRQFAWMAPQCDAMLREAKRRAS